MYFLKKDKIQFVMRKFSLHAMKIAISWLFLGKRKTQEGAGLCNREQLRVEQDRSLQKSCFSWRIILVATLPIRSSLESLSLSQTSKNTSFPIGFSWNLTSHVYFGHTCWLQPV